MPEVVPCVIVNTANVIAKSQSNLIAQSEQKKGSVLYIILSVQFNDIFFTVYIIIILLSVIIHCLLERNPFLSSKQRGGPVVNYRLGIEKQIGRAHV